MSSGHRIRTVAIAIVALAAHGHTFPNSARILSDLDPIDPATGRAEEIAPGAPLIKPAAPEPQPWWKRGKGSGKTQRGDFEAGILVDPSIVGDVDLVLRTGKRSDTTLIGPPSGLPGGHPVPVGVAEPFNLGVPIPFHATGSSLNPKDPHAAPFFPYGARTVQDLNGTPVMVAAFADLDGDGYVGITLLDGDPDDRELERAELLPVGRHLFVSTGGIVRAELAVAAGGPAGAPLRVVLTAGAYVGSLDSDQFDGNVPDGPAVFTHMPFLPQTDPRRVVDGGPDGPQPAHRRHLPGFKIILAFEPDPLNPDYGESFTLDTDGTTVSIDVAEMRSGAFSRFALAHLADPATFQAVPSQILRPGVDENGDQALYQILRDDAGYLGARIGALRLVPVDRLGNITDLEVPVSVTLSTGGSIRIASPDVDEDPYREVVVVPGSRGVGLLLDGSSGAFRGDQLLMEGGGALSAVSF